MHGKLHICLSQYGSAQSRIKSIPFTTKYLHTIDMPPTTTLQRHRPEQIVIMLYYSVFGVNTRAVSELIELKAKIDITPQQVQKRLKFSKEATSSTQKNP